MPVAPARRQNNFTFLRLAFASLVLVSHAVEIVDGSNAREPIWRFSHNETLGTLSVAGFFLISGFLILQSWENRPKLVPYLIKRARRIYPGFIVASILCAFIVAPLGASDGYFSRFKILGFIRQMLLLKQPAIPEVFAGTHFPSVNGSMWTIEYEFRCYLVIAALGVIGMALRPRLWVAGTVAVLLAGTILNEEQINMLMPAHHVILLPVYFVRFISFFAVGCCFYLLRDRIRYTAAGVSVAAAVLFAGLFYPHITVATTAVAGGYLVFAFVFTPIPSLARFGSGADISYGVYLYGWPIQKLINWYFPEMSPWALLGLTLPLAAGCGWASWHLVEKRFLKREATAKTSRRQPASA